VSDLEELVSEISHELKTPIAVISGYAELLAARADERTRLAAASQIGEAAERLLVAVDGLLEAIEREPALAEALASARSRAKESE
jgi:signal transduction histidine kinase